MVIQQPVELRDQAPDRSSVAARVLGRIDEYETVMCETALIGSVGDAAEVATVLGDHRAAFLLCYREYISVRERA